MSLKRPFEIVLGMVLLVATIYQATRLGDHHVAPPVIDDWKLFRLLVIGTIVTGAYTLFDIWHTRQPIEGEA